MPGLVTRTATINFVIPKGKLSQEDQLRYLERYDVNDMPPRDTVNVPLHDLRQEFDLLGTAEEQLDERG
jgi:hypothetical protein